MSGLEHPDLFFQLPEFTPERIEFLQIPETKKRSRKNFLQECKRDPVYFARSLLGVSPFPYQEDILRDRHNRIVACMGRQTGKTSVVAIKALHFALFHKNVKVLITSRSLRQSIFMFDEILRLIRAAPPIRAAVERQTRTLIQFHWGSEIRCFPCAADTLRGYTAHLAICDEAAFMPEEIVVEVILPMLTTTNGQFIMLSTPWGRDHIFYRAVADKELEFHKYIVPTSKCPLPNVATFIEEQRKIMSELQYRMEYECQFLESPNILINQDLIRSCVDLGEAYNREYRGFNEETRMSGSFYLGIDLGKHQDHSVICAVKGERADGKEVLRVWHLKEFALETPYSHILGYAKRLQSNLSVRKIFIDQTGVGDYVVEDAQNIGLSNVEGVTLTAQRKREILTHLKERMAERELIIPDDRDLHLQLNQQEYGLTKTGLMIFRHPQGGHDDKLHAVALAVAASRETQPGIFAAIPRLQKI